MQNVNVKTPLFEVVIFHNLKSVILVFKVAIMMSFKNENFKRPIIQQERRFLRNRKSGDFEEPLKWQIKHIIVKVT